MTTTTPPYVSHQRANGHTLEWTGHHHCEANPPVQVPFNPFFIFDGLNQIRLCGRSVPRLEILLTLIRHVAGQATDFMCFFDANTFYELRDNQGIEQARAYEHLFEEYDWFFVEVSGGTRADDIFLAEAHALNAIVISNDAFKGYDSDYPWVKEPHRVLRVNYAREHLHFNGHRLPIEDDLARSMAALKRVMRRRVRPLM